TFVPGWASTSGKRCWTDPASCAPSCFILRSYATLPRTTFLTGACAVVVVVAAGAPADFEPPPQPASVTATRTSAAAAEQLLDLERPAEVEVAEERDVAAGLDRLARLVERFRLRVRVGVALVEDPDGREVRLRALVCEDEVHHHAPRELRRPAAVTDVGLDDLPSALVRHELDAFVRDDGLHRVDGAGCRGRRPTTGEGRRQRHDERKGAESAESSSGRAVVACPRCHVVVPPPRRRFANYSGGNIAHLYQPSGSSPKRQGAAVWTAAPSVLERLLVLRQRVGADVGSCGREVREGDEVLLAVDHVRGDSRDRRYGRAVDEHRDLPLERSARGVVALDHADAV